MSSFDILLCEEVLRLVEAGPVEVTDTILFLFFSFISLIADGPHHYHPACGHKGSFPISPRFTPYKFFIAMQVQHSYNSSTMVESYLLTSPRFPLRKKEHKSYSGKNRTHDFRTSRCAAYLLDHSSDDIKKIIFGRQSNGSVRQQMVMQSTLQIRRWQRFLGWKVE